jgi:hypothetical protein
MKLFWIGGALGLCLGAGVTFLYFSLATLFSANARAAQQQQRTPIPGEFQSDAENPKNQSAKVRGVGV